MFTKIIAKSIFCWYENSEPANEYEKQLHSLLSDCLEMSSNDVLASVDKGREFVKANPTHNVAILKLVALITVAVSQGLEFDQLEFFSDILVKNYTAP